MTIKNKQLFIYLILFVIFFLLRSQDLLRKLYIMIRENCIHVDELSPPVTVTQRNKTSLEQERIENSKRLCPMIPPNLFGPYKAQITEDEVPTTLEEIEAMFIEVERGGRYTTRDCKSRHHVAIIVPYRDRLEHLKILLLNLHNILLRQQLDYGIFIIEQNGTDRFNRAMLFNVGVAEAIKAQDYQCFIFHDVDLIPEDDRNLYTCHTQPRHMSVSIDKFNYKIPFPRMFGGVSALTLDQFKKVNGYSNMFWGWGGEDTDMTNRIEARGMYIFQESTDIARYKMLKHNKQKPNPGRYQTLKTGLERMNEDGFNNVLYTVVKFELKKLYTWFLIDLHQTKPASKTLKPDLKE